MTIDIPGSVIDAMMHQNALPHAIKTRADLDRYKVIIHDVHPDLIIECGTFQGGSALWLADTAGCQVITIDVEPHLNVSIIHAWDGRVRHIIGSSTHPSVIAAVSGSVEHSRRVMVILDSDHSAEHVHKEMVAYAPLVSVDSYMVVEDGLVRWMPWFGYKGSPLDAIEEFMHEHGDDWEIDLKIEGMSSRTQHPSGWLRKVS